ncbi:MAG: LPXTG cell wall anchor domain-containing protein [Lachnospiraceae bacterium]|nr:LPXTG cell wall anchor domain-containing protein [Lachnospiraceae bacterium]
MLAMPKKIKLIISTMLILFAFSMTAFAANPFTSKSTIVDQDSGGYTKLTIYRNKPEDSVPFNMKNMFPGDTETNNYYLAVSYRGSITVHFHADVKPGGEELAEVLNCKVVLLTTGETLYDGPIGEMPVSLDHHLTSNGVTTEELEYEITASLATSVGNEYMNKELYADFRWWAEPQKIPEDEGDWYDPDDTDPTIKPGTPDTTKPTDTITGPIEPESGETPVIPGELVNPPKTGDTSLLPMIAVMIGCSILLIFLLLCRRRKEAGDEQ